MNLITTSKLSLLASLIKILSSVVINKAVAVSIGPAGLALIGQFQNFMQLCITFGKGGINSGITKYAAEHGANGDRLNIMLSTALKISSFSSFIVGSILILASKQLSDIMFSTDDFTYIFIVFGFSLFLVVLNNFLLSTLNGLKEINTWVKANILQSLYSLVITSILVLYYELHGAFVALVSNQAIVSLILLWMLRKHGVINFKNLSRTFNTGDMRRLLKFSIMALTSAAIVPVTQMLIRDHIGNTVSWEAAGYWQAITHMSGLYLLVIITVLTTYYLPRYSEVNDTNVLRNEILKGYQLVLPFIIVSSIVLYFVRAPLINLLFTPDFYPISDLFLVQFVGNFVKIMAWFLSFLMVAKAMTKEFVISEIASGCLFVLASFYLVDSYGLIGVCYAYVVNYVLYFLAMVVVTKRHWL